MYLHAHSCLRGGLKTLILLEVNPSYPKKDGFSLFGNS
ncbi:Hypothetical protein I595_968 [Croceitalea dokdonensis DOKDO 023]|uniref:Uncharacterized protein n=1 Tax=Croceitalea dokdonensis DOKDO 023 TaxID=1300341 RepID=A0A0P7AWR0_9FLAO|nr:Hypothetical protein I595_968 [Croceitalea dokdonensis DOKDO 023]